MRKIPVTRHFLALVVPSVIFLEKKKKRIFRYGLGECVYRPMGLYHFSFVVGQTKTHTHTRTFIQGKIRIFPTACSPALNFDS